MLKYPQIVSSHDRSENDIGVAFETRIFLTVVLLSANTNLH